MKPDLICLGEFYWDYIFYGLPRLPRLGEEVHSDHFLRAPGGGAAITALAGLDFGLRVGLVATTAASTCEADLAPLASAGIDVSHSLAHPKLPTGITVAVSTSRDRYFLTHPGANRDLETLLPRGLFGYLARARHVHFALMPRDFSIWIRLARRLMIAGVTTSWDPGWSPELPGQRGFREFLRALIIAFPNRQEISQWTRAKSPMAALRRLACIVRLPVLKLGRRGAAALDSGRMLTVPAFSLATSGPLETTGAGDAFNGGFLAAWLRTKALDECLWMGNLAAARRVTRLTAAVKSEK